MVSTSTQNAAVKAILDANGFASVGAARFFINGVDTETTGVDVVARYRWDTDRLGRFDLTAAANFNETEIVALPTTRSSS